MKDQQKLFGGLIAGTLLGIAVGILLAPSSGEITRKKIIDGSVGLKDDLMASVNGSIESLRKQFISKIDQLAQGGKEVVNHTSEKVKV
jgi:gas vesicle protein